MAIKNIKDIEKYKENVPHKPSSLYGNREKPQTNRYIRKCENCQEMTTILDAQFCPYCGKAELSRGKVTEVLYKKIELSEDGKAVTCPHCDNEEPTPGDFCIICGNDIVNRCADMTDSNVNKLVNKGCRTILPGNARYCYKCGNESTFYQKGWLHDWRSENIKKAIQNTALNFEEIKGGRG